MSATDEEVIRALYETLLFRSAEPEGLKGKLDALASGKSIREVIAWMLCSPEFARIHQSFLDHYIGHTGRFTNDVSQFGEVELLIKHMINQAATHHIVVDVGARGKRGSNSYDLLRHCDWRGLLIEANPALIDGLHGDFGACDVTIVNCAVSNYTGDGVLHIGVNDDVSALQEQNTTGWGPTRGQIAVRVRRLGEILKEHAIPLDFDVLSLDIEGEDVPVFNDLIELGYRPRWVIIEMSEQQRGLFTQLVRDNYTVIGMTAPNLILSLDPSRSDS